MDHVKKINDILESVFNLVLKMEEKAIEESSSHDLSITELHTLVAIGPGKPKTMSQVAAALKINVSTLTAAVNKLVRKGYVERFRIPQDRRIVSIKLTETGAAAVVEHEEFHTKTIRNAVAQVSEPELSKLVDSIDHINQYLMTLKHPPAKVEGPFEMKPLKLGKVYVPVPIFQGALSVGLSMSRLAAEVSRQGGVGVIASSKIGYMESDFAEEPLAANKRALKREVKKALELVKDCENRGPIGVNVRWSARHCAEYVKTAVAAGAEVIICGDGVPTTLPRYCADRNVALIPIVSSKRAAELIIRNWAKKYNRTPDGFIFQGPLAGGYLGVKESKIERAMEGFYQNIADMKSEIEELSDCPLIVCGGIFAREDAERAYAYGADGFQIGTRFVTTVECDAPAAFKEAYLNCTEKDVTIITSPEGFPGRVIKNDYVDRIGEESGCITRGLLNAAKGDLENGLVFCGGKVYQADKIECVGDVFKEFT